MSTENEKDYSYVLPSIFIDGHSQPADLTIMGAAAAYRRAQPDGAMVDSKQSEALKDGSILLRDIFGAGLALVSADGRVRLIDDEGDAPAQQSSGIEVHEEVAQVPMTIPVQVYTESRWACPHCLTRWKRAGNMADHNKTCRQCGQVSTLRAVS